MKVDKYGAVIIDDSAQIRIEGWVFHRDSDDPIDATDGELLLGFAAQWALKKLQQAVAEAAIDGLTAGSKRIKATKPN